MKALHNKPLKILGLIGARSGSKGMPDKNIKSFAGRPLIGWIIEKALSSKYINRVVVSTDSPRYAVIAREYGAETPFLRPKKFATNRSLEIEYIKHALKWLKEHESYEPDIVVRLMATSPLQTVEDIDLCIEKILKNRRAQTAIVVAEARQHPLKAFKLAGKELVPYFKGSAKSMISNRQSVEKSFFRANVVACRVETIFQTNSMYGKHVLAHVIPQERAIDIDGPVDFFVAEQIFKKF